MIPQLGRTPRVRVMVGPRAIARFPAVRPAAGHYESFYLKAARPTGGQAVWIRYTVWKAPAAEPVGSLWCTLFDTSLPRPLAWKASFPDPAAPAGEYIRVGDGRLTAESAQGPSWRLTFTGAAPPFPYLQRPWMYRAPVPRTKAESLHPAVQLSGHVEVAGQRLALDGWPGMIGHNWGSEHAERWVWLHGAGFAAAPDAVLDVTLGRIAIAGRTSPWIANGFVELAGRRHRLGGLQRVRGTQVTEAPDRCDFVLPGDGLTVRGRVTAEPGRTVGWAYADPGGGHHDTLHCSVADLELRVGDRPLAVAAAATYEIGLRESDHGVPLEPYPDP
jgi:hypothetical protein